MRVGRGRTQCESFSSARRGEIGWLWAPLLSPAHTDRPNGGALMSRGGDGENKPGSTESHAEKDTAATRKDRQAGSQA